MLRKTLSRGCASEVTRRIPSRIKSACERPVRAAARRRCSASAGLRYTDVLGITLRRVADDGALWTSPADHGSHRTELPRESWRSQGRNRRSPSAAPHGVSRVRSIHEEAARVGAPVEELMRSRSTARWWMYPVLLLRVHRDEADMESSGQGGGVQQLGLAAFGLGLLADVPLPGAWETVSYTHLTLPTILRV